MQPGWQGLSCNLCLLAGIWKPHCCPSAVSEGRAAVGKCPAVPCVSWSGEKTPLITPGCLSSHGAQGLAWYWDSLAGCRVMEVVPQICSSWLAGERAGCIKPRKNKAGGNGGEEMRRGESLVPLCGRKYLPIKENELKAVGVGGEGRETRAGSWKKESRLRWG